MNILDFWIEKFSLIFELLKKAGFKYILIILSCRTITTLMDLLSIGFAVNYFLSKNSKFSFFKNISIFEALLLLIFFIIIKSITRGIAEVTREKVRLEFTDNLRENFLKKILYSSNNSFINIEKKELAGLLIGNISNTVSSLDNFLRFLSSNISLIIYIIGLFSINRNILIPILLSIVATLAAGFVKRYKGWELGNSHLKINNSLISIIGDGLNSLKTIKSSRAQEWVISKFSSETFKNRKYRNKQ